MLAIIMMLHDLEVILFLYLDKMDYTAKQGREITSNSPKV